MKRPIRRTDIEDAFKRLDKLTLEEARMAVAQSLQATHNVDERARGVVAVCDRVASVDDEAANVDDRVKVVGDNVTEVSRCVTYVTSIDCRSNT